LACLRKISLKNNSINYFLSGTYSQLFFFTGFGGTGTTFIGAFGGIGTSFIVLFILGGIGALGAFTGRSIILLGGTGATGSCS
jgi:hypothetical protein